MDQAYYSRHAQKQNVTSIIKYFATQNPTYRVFYDTKHYLY